MKYILYFIFMTFGPVLFYVSFAATSTDILKYQSTSRPAIVVRYPQLSVDSRTFTGQNYSGIVACPATPACRDINQDDEIPSGGSLPCPNICQITRSPNVINSFMPNATVTPPSCPLGYAQIAATNSQNDIRVDQATPYVHISQGEYNALMAGGNGECRVDTVRRTASYCGSTYDKEPSEPTLTWDFPNQQPGSMGVMLSLDYKNFAGCVVTDRRYYYYYNYECRYSQGLMPITGKTIPVTLICSRIRVKWAN